MDVMRVPLMEAKLLHLLGYQLAAEKVKQMEDYLVFLLDNQRVSLWDERWMVHLMVDQRDLSKEHYLLLVLNLE